MQVSQELKKRIAAARMKRGGKSGASLRPPLRTAVRADDVLDAKQPVAQLDTKSVELCLTREAATECRKILSEEKGTRPFVLFSDTEGVAFVHQIAFHSLDDSYELQQEVTAPAQYNRPVVAGSVSMRIVWDQLDSDMKAMGHDPVYVLFHNGAAHDEKVLREQAMREGGTIPARFKFGDSLHLLKRLFPARGIQSWSMQGVYLSLLGESIHEKARGQSMRQHSANYDAAQLRMVFRFVALYMHKYLARTQVDAPLYTVALAQTEVLPSGALGPAAVDLMCRVAVSMTQWRSIEVPVQLEEAKSSNPASAAAAITGDQSGAAAAATVSNTPALPTNPHAVWVTNSGRMRHCETCPSIAKSVSKRRELDSAVLDLLPFCQKCAKL